MSCHYLEPRQRSLDVLLRHLPTGIAWECFRLPGKIAHKLFSAFAEAYEDAWEALCRLALELDPRTTEQLIREWEIALFLPDACLPAAATLDQRRRWVMWRLEKRRWTTVEDWKGLAALFGLEIEITPGWLVQKPALFWRDGAGGVFPEFPLRFDLFPKLGRFRVYIDIIPTTFWGFEYGNPSSKGDGFPIPFGRFPDELSQFRCLIERVCPANVVIIWNDNPLRNGCYEEAFEDAYDEAFC